MILDVDAALVQQSGHVAVKLEGTERIDLAAITKHPGMTVLIAKILEPHVKMQMDRIYKVALDDAERNTKIDAICSVAHAMRLTCELIKMEIAHNWKTLEDAEIASKRAEEEKKKPKMRGMSK